MLTRLSPATPLGATQGLDQVIGVNTALIAATICLVQEESWTISTELSRALSSSPRIFKALSAHFTNGSRQYFNF
ncbi:hypothetical protein [Phenylobacterium sp.]|uniref:hypothetical protein n=1 Tax=Phenylobacterium sp. TaxID=1871053 RepID=UPI0030F45D1B